MSPKRQKVLRFLREGKTYEEICNCMKITSCNLHSTIYQIKKLGVDMSKRTIRPTITERQKAVLLLYMEKMPIKQIAALLQIDCQTVQNHASEGFKRLGLTTPGQDRIAALRGILCPPITMDDPFFN